MAIATATGMETTIGVARVRAIMLFKLPIYPNGTANAIANAFDIAQAIN